MSSNKEHNADMYESSRYSVEQFDKHILFIASGAIASSFAFITDIVNDFANAEDKWAIITSWYLFSGVIFISLVGHYLSSIAHNAMIKHNQLSNEKFNDKIKTWNGWLRTINISMIVGVTTGAFFLIYFIQQNI